MICHFPEHSKKGLIAECLKELKPAETATKSAIRSSGYFANGALTPIFQLNLCASPQSSQSIWNCPQFLGEDVACQCLAAACALLKAYLQVLWAVHLASRDSSTL